MAESSNRFIPLHKLIEDYIMERQDKNIGKKTQRDVKVTCFGNSSNRRDKES